MPQKTSLEKQGSNASTIMTKTSLEKQRSNASTIMTKTRTPTLEHRYDLPGWRMYLIKISSDEEISPEEKETKVKSSFTYVNPKTGECIQVFDRNRTAMLFKIPSKDTSSPLWHNVHSGSYDRWSFGFALDDSFALAILKEALS